MTRKEAIETVKGMVRREGWAVYKAATKRTPAKPGVHVAFGFRHPLEVCIFIYHPQHVMVGFESILRVVREAGFRITYADKHAQTVCLIPIAKEPS